MFYLSKYYLGLTALTSQLNSGRDTLLRSADKERRRTTVGLPQGWRPE